MSRTHHPTQAELESNTRPTRRRAKTRLTKFGDRSYWPSGLRPKNIGNPWRFGYSQGQRSRKEARENKVIGRRLERRRLNRSLAPWRLHWVYVREAKDAEAIARGAQLLRRRYNTCGLSRAQIEAKWSTSNAERST